MSEQSRVLAATIAGAAIGGILGCVFFTEGGRVWRRGLEPALDDFARELEGVRSTAAKAVAVGTEAWRLLIELAGETGADPRGARYIDPRQSTPF